MVNDNLYEVKQMAALFDALGHYRRVIIYRALKRAGSKGVSVGMLSQSTGIGETNLAHHLRMMKKGKIIRSNTVGRFTFLVLNQDELANMFEAIGA
jgi:ArsR family transcriptional regulator, arsenate/arsenite/antimonite-responsive transcriptional repressor